jgi:hypothetical protein
MSVENRIAKTKRDKHESVIERWVNDAHAVGLAFKSIRDEWLYKEDYATFEEYLKQRWGFEKRRAYQLIEAAETAENLCKILHKTEVPKVESQLREVAKAPAEKQAEVCKVVAEICQEEQRPPTANDFKKAVEELVYEDVPDDDDVIEIKSKKDQPEDLIPKIKSLAQAVTNLKRDLKVLNAERGGEWLPLQEIFMQLDAARYAISKSAFIAICPKCGGKRHDSCIVCKGYGFICELRKSFAENCK